MTSPTPEQVYGTPATTFVAGFIGSPPMNLIDVDAGEKGVRAGGVDLPLPAPAPRAGALDLPLEPLRGCITPAVRRVLGPDV